MLPLTSANGPYRNRWRPTSGPLDPTIQPVLPEKTETTRDVHAAGFVPLWGNLVPTEGGPDWRVANLVDMASEKDIYPRIRRLASWTLEEVTKSPNTWLPSNASRLVPPTTNLSHLVFRHEELHANSCGWSSVVARQVRSRSVSYRATWYT